MVPAGPGGVLPRPIVVVVGSSDLISDRQIYMQMVDGALSGGAAICRIDLAIGFQLVGSFFPPLLVWLAVIGLRAVSVNHLQVSDS